MEIIIINQCNSASLISTKGGEFQLKKGGVWKLNLLHKTARGQNARMQPCERFFDFLQLDYLYLN